MNPFLWREARRAIRSRAFFSTFTGMQVAMIWSFVQGFAAPGLEGDENGFMGFWFLVGAYLLAVLPVSGLNAIASEFSDARYDLLRITQLSNWNIVMGKWLVLVMQALLVLVSFLPYLALRYFTGNIDILSEFLILTALGMLSAVLTSLAVLLSTISNWLRRVLAGIFAVFIVLPFIAGFFLSIAASGGVQGITLVGCLLSIAWVFITLNLAERSLWRFDRPQEYLYDYRYYRLRERRHAPHDSKVARPAS